MNIRTRTRGTNQYQVKGELVGADICKCGALNDIEEWSNIGGHPMKKRKTEYKCHRCGSINKLLEDK